MKYKAHPEKRWRHLASIPFIYGMIFPSVFLDLSLTIYKNICFRLYGLELPKRAQYIKDNRHRLQYLKPLERFNCMYCGYVNGVFAYAVRIAGDTEKYWCSIKHKKEVEDEFIEPTHHKDFLEYGDEKAYKNIAHKK
jgi:hypothetical protein